MKEISNYSTKVVQGPAQVQFVELSGDEHDKVGVGSFGQQGTGKTNFGASFPDPIGVVPLDRKTRYTIAKAAQLLGKKVILPKDDLIRVTNPMQLAMMPDDCGKSLKPRYGSAQPQCCTIHYYRWHVNRVKETAFRLAEMPDSKCKSIVVDTGSQLSEDMLFANYGRSQKIMPRDRGAYNQEMIDFLNSISNKHFLITHKAREIWSGDGANAKPTGAFRAKGFTDIGYYVSVEIEHYRGKKAVVKEDGSRWLPFYLDIRQCQANAALVGEKQVLEDEMITFANLATLIYEGTSVDDWE